MSYDSHDIAVMQRINRFIAKANSDHPKLTVSEKLEAAWSANIEERMSDSTNTIGRDADYYFAARKEVAKDTATALKYAKAGVGEVAWVVYAALKVGAKTAGHPEWTQTDKGKPNAPVGGFVWMNRGCADGFDDLGTAVRNVPFHKPSV